MKTPRQILLQRHREAETELDAVRHKALAAISGPAGTTHPPTAGVPEDAQIWSRRSIWGLDRLRAAVRVMFAKTWQELIWPSRRAWTGIAALWVLLLAVNLMLKAASPGVPAARSIHSPDLVRAYEEQRRVLAELLAPVNPPPAASARPLPHPRSERPVLFKAC